jgi:hypothetical protein
MNTQIKVGSRVVFRGEKQGTGYTLEDLKPFPNDLSEVGNTGTVEAKVGGILTVRMDSGRVITEWYAHRYELVRAPEPAATVYLIAGMTTEYATQESAEEFLREYGDNGKEYTITQVVARRRVNRTTELQSI